MMPKARVDARLARRDEALHAARTLLRTGSFKERVAGALFPPGTRLDRLRVAYVRYKPRTDVTVLYRLRQGGQELRAYAKAFTQGAGRIELVTGKWERKETPPSPPFAASFAHLADVPCVLFAFPADRNIRGLRSVATSRGVKRILQQSSPEIWGGGWEVSGRSIVLEILRYKPESRCVVDATFKRKYRAGPARPGEWRRVVLKAYGDRQTASRVCGRMRELADSNGGGFRLPGVLGFHAGRAVLIQEHLPFTPVKTLIDEERPIPAEEVGRALARWHDRASRPGRAPGAERLAEFLIGWARHVDRLTVGKGTFRRACEQLQKSVPEGSRDIVLVHGDLHAKHILVGAPGLYLVDLDQCREDDGVFDLASLLAGEIYREEVLGRESAVRWPFLSRLVEAYQEARRRPLDARMLRWATAAHLISRTLPSLRGLGPDWRERLDWGAGRALGILDGGGEILHD